MNTESNFHSYSGPSFQNKFQNKFHQFQGRKKYYQKFNNKFGCPFNENYNNQYETGRYNEIRTDSHKEFGCYERKNKFSQVSNGLVFTKKEVYNKEESTKSLKSTKLTPKSLDDKTEDSSNKASISSSDEREIPSKEISSTVPQNKKNFRKKERDQPNFNKNRRQNKNWNKENRNKRKGIKNEDGQVKKGKRYFKKKDKENTEILNVDIKIGQNEHAIFTLKRYDDLCKTVKLFCEVYHIKDELMKPLIITIMSSLNMIYSAYNMPLSLKDINQLQLVKEEQNKKDEI